MFLKFLNISSYFSFLVSRSTAASCFVIFVVVRTHDKTSQSCLVDLTQWFTLYLQIVGSVLLVTAALTLHWASVMFIQKNSDEQQRQKWPVSTECVKAASVFKKAM